MKTTLWERLLPQARELILQKEGRYPATTEIMIKKLQDPQFHLWSELPYYIVKMLHERIYGDVWADVDQDEVKVLFEEYYYE